MDYPTSPTRKIGHTKDLLEEVHAKNLLEELHVNIQESEVRRISKHLVGTETKGALFQV